MVGHDICYHMSKKSSNTVQKEISELSNIRTKKKIEAASHRI
jgi:hypothetical protein